MPLTFETILRGSGIHPAETQAIRHVFVEYHEDSGESGLSIDSTDQEILDYTARQSADPRRFPLAPPRYWVVFMREGGTQARLWKVLENRGQVSANSVLRYFDLAPSGLLTDLERRLVIGWKSPRAWRLNGTTAGRYPVIGIADAEPIPFPGFDRLILDYAELQAVMSEQRFASWRTALASVMGIYAITDMRDGRQYVGKADGAQNICQRWSEYAVTGHGGNVELKSLTPSTFRFSLLRVFDPSTPASVVDAAESHFKEALGTRKYGLNRN